MALVTESGYPYHGHGSGTWCHQLVTGLAGHRYQLVALVGGGTAGPAYPLASNVTEVRAVPVWGPPVTAGGWLARRRSRQAATGAAVLLCRGMLADGRHHAGQFREGLVRLAGLAAGGAHPLPPGTPLPEVLADAWRAAGATPPLSLHDAGAAAVLLAHALRPLAVPEPRADLCHPTSGGLALLVALAAKWRAGVPYLLTEQGVYLRERQLDYRQAGPAPVKAVLLRFLRALARLGYAEAATVVAANRFTQRWQLRHGAHPARVVVVPGGVDPERFRPPAGVPAGRTVAWVGRVEPHKDLHTLLRGFARVRRALPDARLRLVGPVADRRYGDSCRALADRLRLAGAVEWAGPASRARDAYAAAEVVARTSVCEGYPYPVVEAMMCGRATVSADVGGVAEVVGETGLLVPPGDPPALAAALAELLRDPDRRRKLGEAAHRRAREAYPMERMLGAYRRLYEDAVAGGVVG